ncbi:transmembrane anchor protein [Vibrio sp. WXL103]|uniref:transmembrane anchor protein n=1 Tax=unclassified Vibrio TaxID=2614977 RepID=UPI003EC81E6B
MYNRDKPSQDELPTTKQLVRSTVIALTSAIVLLVTVILPAEYAIDPTGIGKAIGLTKMGEIKAQLAEEALDDQKWSHAVVPTASAKANPSKVEGKAGVVSAVGQSDSGVDSEWKDKILLTLKPGAGAEVKLVMDEGQIAQFEWVSKGGPVNYDAHGDGNGHSISYQRGRGVPNDEGDLVAAFTGNHGWFFRNRNENVVMVILRTSGEYSEVKRVF